MRPNQVIYTPEDDNLTGFASNVTGATFTLTATTAADGMAHLVIVTNDSATDHSGKTIALVGTNANGDAQTETLTGPGSSTTSTSTKYWKTLTSATPSATIGADTFDIGWTDDVISPTYPIDWRSPYAANVYVDVTGTVNFDIEQTFDNVLAGDTPSWVAISALDSKTADTYGNPAVGATAIRLLLNSLTAGATIKVSTSQANSD